MGRAKHGKHKIPFVALTWEVLNSAAYIDLPYSVRSILPYFLGKPKRPHNSPEYYGVEFTFSYGEASRYGLAAATFSKAIVQLVRNGFVDPVDKGGLRGDGKSCSLFSLSSRWKMYGEPDFRRVEWGTTEPRRQTKPHFKKGGLQLQKRRSGGEI